MSDEELYLRLSPRAVKNIEKPKPLVMKPMITSLVDTEIPFALDGKTLLVLKGNNPAILLEAKDVLMKHFSHKQRNINTSLWISEMKALNLNESKIDHNGNNNGSPSRSNAVKVNFENLKCSSYEEENNILGKKASKNNFLTVAMDNAAFGIQDDKKHAEEGNKNTPDDAKHVAKDAPIKRYTRDFLLDLATSQISLSPPKDWESMKVALPRTIGDMIDIAIHRQKFLARSKRMAEESESREMKRRFFPKRHDKMPEAKNPEN